MMRDEADRSRSAAESAYAALREDIRAGILPADARLTETTLADQLGMSRTPVREAVKRLIIEGFLTRAPGEGLHLRREQLLPQLLPEYTFSPAKRAV